MKRWLQWVAIIVVAGFVAVYIGDWTVFHLRGAPLSKVTINRYLNIPLKGNKTEFDYLGTQDVPCSVSIFPQAGESPCWQLRRNVNQGTVL